MDRAKVQDPPSFYWQGVLILLPLVVLAGVGLFSLRQDKILAQHEAAQRAQAVADELLAMAWTQTTAVSAGQSQGRAFEVDDSGRMLFPPPVAAIPAPKRLAKAELSEEQARLWRAAEQAELAMGDRAGAIGAWRNFIDAGPPHDFVATAHYSLGLLLGTQGRLQEAAQEFDLVLRDFPEATGESGLPLEPLAQLKLLELEAQATNRLGIKSFVSREALCSRLIAHPMVLTPFLLNLAEQQAGARPEDPERSKWNQLWADQEFSRKLFAAAAESSPGGGLGHLLIGSPRVFRFSTPKIGRRNPVSDLEAAADSEPSRANQAWVAIRYEAPATELPPAAATSKSFEIHPGPNAGNGAGELFSQLGKAIPRAASNWYVCRTEAEISSQLEGLLANNSANVPDYLGVSIELGSKRLAFCERNLRLWREAGYFGRRGGGVKKEYLQDPATDLLASASQVEAGAEPLKIKVYLTSPATLFKQQRARTFWFGSLIGLSTCAALVGLAAAWNAFNRQQQLNEMKSNFVSSVSHELRAPIASVRLMAESLEGGKVVDPQRQNEYFRFIGQETRRLSALIENVLDFSRIEQNRKQYELEPTEIGTLTQQTVQLMQVYAVERQVALKLDLNGGQSKPGELQILADGRALQQALINLIDNALKHSPKGQTVTVGLEVHDKRCSQAGDHLEAGSHSTAAAFTHLLLWVQDHGCGIPREEHERIFERFYRLGSELRRETPGVGIGLSIVKHIAEAHGGKIVLKSAVGEGSRFTLELPSHQAT